MKLKSLVSLLIIMSFLVLAACGSGGNNNGNGTAANNTSNNTSSNTEKNTGTEAPEDVELRMTWWGGQERHDKTLEVIELYEEKNPHVTIVAEYSGFDGYFDKLTTQFAAGNAPDIIQYGGNLNDFVARGVVLPLNEFTGNELDISKHDQSMIDSAIFDGELYGVTLGSNAFAVLINKTLFDQANVPLPSREWTWEELNDIGAQLTESLDGIYGTADFEENGFGMFLEQRGKSVHVDGVIGFDEQDVMDWFQLWDDMRKSGAAVIPEIQASASQTPEQSLIVTKEVAMQLIANNQFGSYNNAIEDELKLYIYPHDSVTGKNGTRLGPSQYFAGYSETEHPAEVAKFLSFFTNDLEATAILGNDRGAPVNSDVRDSLVENSNETDKEIFAHTSWVNDSSDAPYVPNLPGYNETQDLFKRAGEKIAFGQSTVEEASKEYYTELLKVMEKYNEE